MAVKGVMYNLKNTYLGLQNRQRFRGGGGGGEGEGGGVVNEGSFCGQLYSVILKFTLQTKDNKL